MLLEMIQARDFARPMPDDRMTVGKWLTHWLGSDSVTRLRATTQEAYRYQVRLLLPELGNVPLRKLRAPLIEETLRRLNVTGTRSVLSTALKDAQRAGHITTNEAALARSHRTPRRGLTAPDTATVRAILDQLKPHRLHALFVLLAGTGLRIGEATGLRWEDIDDGETALPGRPGVGGGGGPAVGAPTLAGPAAREGGGGPGGGIPPAAHGARPPAPQVAGSLPLARRLTVTYQVQRIDGELVHTDPKTDTAGRVVHLPPVLQAALRSHKARQNEERLRAGSKWREADLVFTTLTGQPVAESTAQWLLARAAKEAGVRHVSPHDLRRWAASQLEDALGREASQLVLGHTSSVMTERYITVRDTMLSRAADAIEEAIG